LVVDYGDRAQMEEVKRINAEAETMHSVLPNDSPQKAHFKRIAIVTETILEKSCVKSESGCTCGNIAKATPKTKA